MKLNLVKTATSHKLCRCAKAHSSIFPMKTSNFYIPEPAQAQSMFQHLCDVYNVHNITCT